MRKVVLLVSVLTVGFASAASSQDVDVTALQMRACTSIKDAAARARCYDRAMSVPGSESEPAMVGIGSNAPLVAIPQSPVTIPQPPAVTPQLSTTIPQPSSPAQGGPPSEAPPTAKSETPGTFDMTTIVRSITPSGIGALTQPGAGEAENWQVKANNASLDQASRLVATLKSPDGKASLVLQCRDGGTQAYVSTDFYLGVETVRVTYRISGNPAPESRWSIASDGRSAIASNAIEFINSLADGGALVMRLVDYNDADHDLKFNIGAISNLRTQIATVCRWPGTAPAEQLVSEQTPPSPRNAKPKPTARKPVGPPLQLR